MMARTIRADGVTWPLDTYIDALAFRRVDPFDQPCFDGDVRLVTIAIDGRVTPATYASQVRWFETLAYRPLDYTRQAAPCDGCGEPIYDGEDGLCLGCENEPW